LNREIFKTLVIKYFDSDRNIFIVTKETIEVLETQTQRIPGNMPHMAQQTRKRPLILVLGLLYDTRP